MGPSTIGGINHLPEEEKRKIYSRVIPRKLLDRFNLPEINSVRLQSFLKFDFEPGSSDVEMSLFHELRFPDPILYGHLTDTMNGQIHVLLYILNDPDAPRFNVDRMPILMGKVCKAIVNARMFLPVFHSPYTTVSENNAVLMELDTIPSREPIQKIMVKPHVVPLKNFPEANAIADKIMNTQ